MIPKLTVMKMEKVTSSIVKRRYFPLKKVGEDEVKNKNGEEEVIP